MKISDIVEFNPTRTLKKGTLASFVEMAAVPEYVRDIAYVDEKEFSSGSKFKNGDTLFARITPCLENGKTAKVNCLRDDEIAHGSTEFIVMAPRSEDDEDFVYYLSRDPEFREFAKSRMQGTSGRQRVSWQSLADYELPDIEPTIRKRIGEILKSFDDKIALNREMNKTLEVMAQAIFKSWFVDFEPFKEGEFVESELGMIPKGWDVKKLGNTKIIIEDGDRGKNYPSGNELMNAGFCPFLNNKNIIGDFISFTQTDFISEEKYHALGKGKVAIGDLILTTRGSIGNIGIFHPYLPYRIARINSGMVVIKHNNDFNLTYLYYLLKSAEMKKQYTTISSGSVQKQLPIRDLKNILLMTPPQYLQSKFAGLTNPILKNIQHNQQQVEILSTLRDTLLSKLLSGEIEV